MWTRWPRARSSSMLWKTPNSSSWCANRKTAASWLSGSVRIEVDEGKAHAALVDTLHGRGERPVDEIERRRAQPRGNVHVEAGPPGAGLQAQVEPEGRQRLCRRRQAGR